MRGSARFTFVADDGIVVVEVKKGEKTVSRETPVALRERLGPDATLALVSFFDATRKEWAVEVTELAGERFERRLAAEISQLRSELTQEVHELRVEFKGLEGSVKDAFLQQTRWLFGMWVGQLAATAAIVAAMFRIYSP